MLDNQYQHLFNKTDLRGHESFDIGTDLLACCLSADQMFTYNDLSQRVF